MLPIVLFCLIATAFAVPTETLVGGSFGVSAGITGGAAIGSTAGIEEPNLKVRVPLKSDLSDEPQPVKTFNKIPIYGPQAIDEFNYDYVKVPYYPYFETYNKNYLNFYPTTGTSFGLPRYYPMYYPNRSYYDMKKYVGQYSPSFPVYGGKYAYYGSQYQLPQYYKYAIPEPRHLIEESGVPTSLTSLIV